MIFGLLRIYIRPATKPHLMGIFIIFAIIMGIGLGFIMLAGRGGSYTERETMYLQFLGQIMLRMLQGLSLPLMAGCVVSAIANFDSYIASRIGGQFIVFVAVNAFLAAGLGVCVSLLMKPGVMNKNLKLDEPFQELESNTVVDNLLDLLRNLFPRNVIEMNLKYFRTSLIKPNGTNVGNKYKWKIKKGGTVHFSFNTLGVLSWSILLGTALHLMKASNEPLINLFRCLYKMSSVIIVWIMWLSPVMILFLMAGDICEIETKSGVLTKILYHVVVVYIACLLMLCIVYPLIIVYFTRKNPFAIYITCFNAIITAFCTGSSSATLPIVLKCLLEHSSVDPRVVWFVIPLANTLNMEGSAVFLGSSSLFIAQFNDIQLNWGMMITIMLLSTISCLSRIPGSSANITLLTIVLNGVNLRNNGLGLLITIKWILDPIITVVNIMGDVTCTLVLEAYNRDLLDTRNLEMDDLLVPRRR